MKEKIMIQKDENDFDQKLHELIQSLDLMTQKILQIESLTEEIKNEMEAELEIMKKELGLAHKK